MTKQEKPGKPSDLVKGSGPSTAPELKEKDLDKVSGGKTNPYLMLVNATGVKLK